MPAKAAAPSGVETSAGPSDSPSRPMRTRFKRRRKISGGGSSSGNATTPSRRAHAPKMSGGRLLARVPRWRTGDALALHTPGEDGLAEQRP